MKNVDVKKLLIIAIGVLVLFLIIGLVRENNRLSNYFKSLEL